MLKITNVDHSKYPIGGLSYNKADLKRLLGKPALRPGDDPKEHWLLFEALAASLEPHSQIEWLLVSDLCHREWEHRHLRTRRIQLESYFEADAVKELLLKIGVDALQASKLSMRWFENHARTIETVLKKLKKAGKTRDDINLIVMMQHSDEIRLFDQCIAQNELSRFQIRREFDRQREAALKRELMNQALSKEEIKADYHKDEMPQVPAPRNSAIEHSSP